MSKTHWKKLTNPNYIGAYSLEDGKDLIVEITNVKREFVTGENGKKDECTVAELKGQKPFVLNATNQKSISKALGTPFIEEWIGRKITLYVSFTKLKGDDVECLRVRGEAPKAATNQKPELTPTHPKWNDAKKAIKSGTYKIADLLIKYTISTENEKLLLA